jgi:hypothetical protein
MGQNLILEDFVGSVNVLCSRDENYYAEIIRQLLRKYQQNKPFSTRG